MTAGGVYTTPIKHDDLSSAPPGSSMTDCIKKFNQSIKNMLPHDLPEEPPMPTSLIQTPPPYDADPAYLMLQYALKHNLPIMLPLPPMPTSPTYIPPPPFVPAKVEETKPNSNPYYEPKAQDPAIQGELNALLSDDDWWSQVINEEDIQSNSIQEFEKDLTEFFAEDDWWSSTLGKEE